jgi:hypothetical protein
MRRWILIIVAIAVIVVIVASGLIESTNLNGADPQTARNAVMATIVTNYPDTQIFLHNLNWQGGLFGVDTYVYRGSGWTVRLNITQQASYNVTVRFEKGNVSVDWLGTYHNGEVTEISGETFNVPHTNTPQEQILTDVLTFMRAGHGEPTQFLSGVRFKGAEVLSPDGMVGSTNYLFTGGGWNVTFHSPVVPNPIIQVHAVYAPLNDLGSHVIIEWKGTWQNGIVTETLFRYTP